MYKRYFIYLACLTVLHGLFLALILFTFWDDGSPLEDNTAYHTSVFVVNYILGFPFGLVVDMHDDLRTLLLLPVNAGVQYLGICYLLKLAKKKTD